MTSSNVHIICSSGKVPCCVQQHGIVYCIVLCHKSIVRFLALLIMHILKYYMLKHLLSWLASRDLFTWFYCQFIDLKKQQQKKAKKSKNLFYRRTKKWNEKLALGSHSWEFDLYNKFLCNWISKKNKPVTRNSSNTSSSCWVLPCCWPVLHVLRIFPCGCQVVCKAHCAPLPEDVIAGFPSFQVEPWETSLWQQTPCWGDRLTELCSSYNTV